MAAQRSMEGLRKVNDEMREARSTGTSYLLLYC